MSFLAVSEVQQATRVSRSFAGSFTRPGSQELLIIKGDTLVLYRYSPRKGQPPLQLVLEETFSATPLAIEKVSVPDGLDTVVVCFSQVHLVIMGYEVVTNSFAVHSLHYLGEQDLADVAAGSKLEPILRVHPNGTLVALLTQRRYLFFFPITTRTTAPTESSKEVAHQQDDDAWGDEDDIENAVGGADAGATAVAVSPPPEEAARPAKVGKSTHIDLFEDVPSVSLRAVRDMIFVKGDIPTLMFLRETESAWAGRVNLRDMQTGQTLSKLLCCCANCVSFTLSVDQQQGADQSIARVESLNMWSVEGLPYNAQYLVSLPPSCGTSGALCFCANAVVHLSLRGSCAGFYLNPRGKVEADSESTDIQWHEVHWAEHTRKNSPSVVQLSLDDTVAIPNAEDTLLVSHCESGNLFSMYLSSDERMMHKVRLQLTGRTHTSSCLAAVSPSVVFVGSLNGDSVLLAYNRPEGSPLATLRRLDTLSNVGPIVDACVVDTTTLDTTLSKPTIDEDGQQGQPFLHFEEVSSVHSCDATDALPSIESQMQHMELLTVSGKGSSGSLNIHQRGLKFHTFLQKAIDCVSVFALQNTVATKSQSKRMRDDEQVETASTSFLLLTSATSTMVLRIGEAINQVPASETKFCTSERTVLACKCDENGVAVQVTEGHVVLVNECWGMGRASCSVSYDGEELSVKVHRALIESRASTLFIALLMTDGQLRFAFVPVSSSSPPDSAAITFANASEDTKKYTAVAIDRTRKLVYAVAESGVLDFFAVDYDTKSMTKHTQSISKFCIFAPLYSSGAPETLKAIPPSKPLPAVGVLDMLVTTLGVEVEITGDAALPALWLLVITTTYEFNAYRIVSTDLHTGAPLVLRKEAHSLHDASRQQEKIETIGQKQAAKVASGAEDLTKQMKSKAPLFQEFTNVGGVCGVHLAGDQPKFCVSVRNHIKLIEHDVNTAVRGFAQLETGTVKHGAIYCGEGRIAFISRQAQNAALRLDLETSWPTKKLRLNATPHFAATFAAARSCFVVTSAPQPFRPCRPPFDVELEMKEEGAVTIQHPTHKPMSLSEGSPIAMTDRYTIKLFHVNTWNLMDSFQLDENEVVTAASSAVIGGPDSRTVGGKIHLVPFDPANSLEVFVVGTGFPLGEDTPCRGRILLFRTAVEGGTRKIHPLHSRTTKGPVTALANMNGNLLVTIGATVNAFSYDWYDKKLVTRAIFFASTYITSLSVVKNYVLLGDLYDSVQLVRYREDNHTLVSIGKDPQPASTNATEFLYHQGQLGLLSTDADKNLTLFAYKVKKNSEGAVVEGNLQPQGEIRLSSEVTKLLRIRQCAGGNVCDSSVVFYTTADGGIGTIQPVSETRHRNLRALTGRLCTELPHNGGLHPKVFRSAQRKMSSTGIFSRAKGEVLDLQLFDHLAEQSLTDRVSIAASIGSKDERLIGTFADLADQRHFF